MRTSGLVVGDPPDEIPEGHRDLVECPPVAALSTLMRDGHPQTSVVWSDLEDGLVRVNTMRGFLKERNMRSDPRVTLLGYDPRDPLRYVEVRGTVVEMTEDGAAAHLDAIASKYAGRPIRYFGDCIPVRFAETEIPVLCRIRPVRVVAVDARGSARSRPGRTERGSPDNRLQPPAIDGVSIPPSHLDLLLRPVCGVLTTIGRDGAPQSSLVWVTVRDGYAETNTTLERQKGRNLAANPAVSLLVVDPEDTGRYVQVRGDAELIRPDAEAHLDALTRRYTTHPRFYGFVYPTRQRTVETRVICRIHARRVSLDAIHA